VATVFNINEKIEKNEKLNINNINEKSLNIYANKDKEKCKDKEIEGNIHTNMNRNININNNGN
jgi:hypothetical protein